MVKKKKKEIKLHFTSLTCMLLLLVTSPLTDLTAGGEDEEAGTPAVATTGFSFPCAISLVFTTSNGPVAIGPTTPATKPEIIDCQGARILPSPSFFLQTTVSIANLVENMHAWFVPFRRTVGATPAHRPRKPSSNHIVPENGAAIKQVATSIEMYSRIGQTFFGSYLLSDSHLRAA